MIDLNSLSKKAYEIAEKRYRNNGHIKSDTLSMLKHCASEVVEAVEANRENRQDDFKLELGDIIMCVLIICGKNKIDIETILNDVQKKNTDRANKIGDKL